MTSVNSDIAGDFNYPIVNYHVNGTAKAGQPYALCVSG